MHSFLVSAGVNYIFCTAHDYGQLSLFVITSPPIGGGRGIVMPMSVCLCVCPCFRKISMCNISAISQPIIMKLGIHITYGYTVTDKYFQNFRSKVKVVERLKTLFGHISGTNDRRDSGLVSKCRGMSQPTWWRGGRGLPSLIALFQQLLVSTCATMCQLRI